MPHPLLMALFANHAVAEHAALDLHRMGIRREDLSVVASNHQVSGEIADEIGGSPGSEMEDSRAAGRAGEILGSILSAVAIGVPGSAAVVAGPLAAELGEAAAHVVGQLSSTLMKAGLSEGEALDWQMRIHGGAVLLGVHVRGSEPGAVESVLARRGAEQIVSAQWSDD